MGNVRRKPVQCQFLVSFQNHQEIHFPIKDEEVIQNFTQSPVGVGAATIIDEKIRGSVELNPEDFEVGFLESVDSEADSSFVATCRS